MKSKPPTDAHRLYIRWGVLSCLCATFILLPGPQLFAFSGGSGTANDPYLVANAQHLDAVRNFPSAHFRQIADINLDIPPWNAGEGWPPIGSGQFNGFTGVYDGNGHRISGLFVNRNSDAQGLFGYLTAGGQIRNLGLVDVSVSGGNWYIGGLVGRMMGGEIQSSFVTGTVIGQDRQVGCLVGRLDSQDQFPGVVENAYSHCTVSGQDRVGGLIGKIPSGEQRVGHVYSFGPVSGTGTHVNPLIGRRISTLSEPNSAYWVLDVGDFTVSDELQGQPRTLEQMRAFTTFLWWDFKGESINGAEGIWNIGNGRNNGMPYLSWQYPDDPGIDAGFAAGSGSLADPFLISTAQHLALINFHYLNNQDVHFALVNDIDLGASMFSEGEGWVPIGTSQYRSSSVVPIDAAKYFSGHFDGRGHAITRLTTNRLWGGDQGLFGLAHGATVKNLSVVDIDIIGGYRHIGGLIGRALGSEVENVVVAGELRGFGTAFISPTAAYAGGLVGYLADESSVSSSGAKVNMTGWDDVGGLVGSAEFSTITESWAHAWVRCRSSCGGLVGTLNDGADVADSYSRGQVSTRVAGTQLGGFLGRVLGGTVRDGYSTSFVFHEAAANPVDRGFAGFVWADNPAIVMSGNYWDTEASGQSSSACNASGKTTDEMTYPYPEGSFSGWNFDSIWAEDVDSLNDGYPYLRAFDGFFRPQLDVSPTRVVFGIVPVGSTSPPEFVTLTNLGMGELEFSDFELIAATPDVFAVVENNCLGQTLEANASCVISFTFTPLDAGFSTASFRITSNASGSPNTVMLSGGPDKIFRDRFMQNN